MISQFKLFWRYTLYTCLNNFPNWIQSSWKPYSFACFNDFPIQVFLEIHLIHFPHYFSRFIPFWYSYIFAIETYISLIRKGWKEYSPRTKKRIKIRQIRFYWETIDAGECWLFHEQAVSNVVEIEWWPALHISAPLSQEQAWIRTYQRESKIQRNYLKFTIRDESVSSSFTFHKNGERLVLVGAFRYRELVSHWQFIIILKIKVILV